MSERPRARKRELVIRELSDEVIVFDERTSKVHCLNETSWRVFRACDGTRSREAIAGSLELDATVVAFALDLLARADLLEEPTPPAPELADMTRREAVRFVKKVCIGVAVPAVMSILAPTVAEAASCVPRGGTCGHFDAQRCCPGLRCSSDICQ